ncbi:YhgE/Pip domain-containing protein [Paenibacillus sp. MBLB4367]|uniref:YhgE/Pip domain-containing protein n=1 Tax=Paenibacillus sp. MBLB4367 TaxID=3384767 RepID=UPI0039081573
MKQALQTFFKQPTTKAGIAVALMFQLIFCVIWMTGYDGVTDNAKHLKIAIVNEDAGMGGQIAGKLQASLPFQTEMAASKSAAEESLNSRDVQMVIIIPEAFTKKLQTAGDKASVQFLVNESNPATIKSIMQGVAGNVTAMVNKEAVAAGAQAILTQANVPAQQAQTMAQGISEKVVSDFQSVNKVKNMSNQMIPMMLVLASFVGSMIMSMNLQQSSMMIQSLNKWQKIGMRFLINVVAAVFISAIGSSLVLAFGGQSAHGFLAMWGFQTVFLMTFMFFTQMFVVLFGIGGMLFNIIGMSVQLVTSGAMVPREMLSSFYLELSRYLPATYAVEGNMNLLFGGPGVGSDVGVLLGMTAITAAVAFGAVALRKESVVQRAAASAQ